MLETKIKELEQKIKICESEYDNFIKIAQPIKEECTNSIIDEMKNFCKKTIENKVKSEVKITNKLGIDNLRKLKNSMNKILKQMDSEKENLINNKEIWLINKNWFGNLDFTKGDRFGMKYNNQKNISHNISETMRKLTGDIGNLLNEYNYINVGKGNWKLENGNIVYGFSWVDEKPNIKLKEKQKEYENLFEKTFKKYEEIYELKKELEETKAFYLWEQA
ncbi:hypothetical protein EJM73_08970 [Clostridium botulinum]|uniref:hypothetical protein n=1 Tax=Clostridium botulinum TaxID=1491 RepID=UPI00137628E8|nr:hypothetical protein [Clostridium botulinum]NCI19756.1 hypothetical protein [Clostridium botulinum]NCI35794.1 hypothetical protein [Clostridium botulinum]NCI71651.1 hypothetical protein [Clostridium botulinum]NDI38843.1 hypothetical protein [Clostridium botulinum]